MAKIIEKYTNGLNLYDEKYPWTLAEFQKKIHLCRVTNERIRVFQSMGGI